MSLQKRVLFFILLLLLLSFSFLVIATELFTEVDQNNNLRLGNDYIVIVVNKDENGQGRFAIETTGGAPFQPADDNKPLVYGRPKPWTSYTSIWLNGDYYVFGGETGRRAGATGKYGTVVQEPYVEKDSVITTGNINDILLVDQVLTIVKSSTTGLYDSVQIKYRIENISDKPQKIGLRIVLDTMLGENDGAPFRIGNDAVTTDTIYYKEQLPQFWQAFDSISNPTVTSQGTFTGPGVTPPDQVKLADWGSMADGVWDFDFNPGEIFLRKGEYEIDSAIAMYWVPEYLGPGESRSYITNYGLGGITIVPGLLSLGITSPAEVLLDTPDRSIPVIAYVENTSEITAKNVRISIDLPDSLQTEKVIHNLGDLESGEIAQIIWDVYLAGNNIPASSSYSVKVEADNTDSNQVIREIKFIGPPDLRSELKVKDDITVINGRLIPNPFTIEARLKNEGASPLYDTSIELLLPPGLVFVDKEKPIRILEDIDADEEIDVRWRVKALNIEGQLPVAVNIKALHGYQETRIYEGLVLPKLKPVLYFELQNKDSLRAGDSINIEIRGENLEDIDLMDLYIKYDPEALLPVHVSRGTIFLKDDKYLPWTRPDLSTKGIIRINQLIPLEATSGTIGTIRFKVINPDNIELEWDQATYFIFNREEVEIILNDLKFN
ncbi:MAG TPA: cohesin domain-containing protein [Halanaerobiales bacterium]|nr:cohesin domain-containing protein [Halanaerobiales bacterium]HPZ63294.1 cohesin domain-containing protein [Halanaerobiales bacterium]